MKDSRTSPKIRVKCPDCGLRTLTVDDVGFTHASGTVTGWFWYCDGCDELRRAAAEPAVLALLHAVGVRGLSAQSTSAGSSGLDHRALVSLRILLDHPEVLASMTEAHVGSDGPDQDEPTGDVTSRP